MGKRFANGDSQFCYFRSVVNQLVPTNPIKKFFFKQVNLIIVLFQQNF
jgi:hypothetical protein